MERCQWWDKLSAVKCSFDQKAFFNVEWVFGSFVVTEGTRIGFLHMYGSYYTLDTPENDNAFLSHIALLHSACRGELLLWHRYSWLQYPN